ncbi:MAG: GNAT family N-acetyltransferase, partial [Microbacterium sp.]
MRNIRDLDTVELIIEAQSLLDSIRGPERVIDAGTLRALEQSGNYVVGLFDDESGQERMVGASVAFFGVPGQRTMHSHITALLPEYRGR